MYISISHPGTELPQAELDGIHRDVEKIGRRLQGEDDVYLEVRVNHPVSRPLAAVTMRLEYGREQVTATAEAEGPRRAVREAREDILRQINQRGRGSHSDYAKGRR